jgi:hypothetical protein
MPFCIPNLSYDECVEDFKKAFLEAVGRELDLSEGSADEPLATLLIRQTYEYQKALGLALSGLAPPSGLDIDATYTTGGAPCG